MVTALLLGPWIHSRVGRGFAGTLAEGQNTNRPLGVLALAKHVAFQRVAPYTSGLAAYTVCFPTVPYFYSARSRAL